MPNSDSFDRLIQKALQRQDFPPMPDSLLTAWRPQPAEKSVNWLWLMPGLVFVLGVSIGVWLAPMGLGKAFHALGTAFVGIWRNVPESTLAWAFALLLASAVFAFDSIRSALGRLK
jgi:hypothetical protein